MSLSVLEIGEVPHAKEVYYRPLASCSPPVDLAVNNVPHVRSAMQAIETKLVLPSPHNAGLVSVVYPKPGQEEFDIEDVAAVDLTALRVDGNKAELLPTDREGVVKGTGDIAISGAITFTWPATGLVKVTHIVETPTPWNYPAMLDDPSKRARPVIKSLGIEAMLFEVADQDSEQGSVKLKPRVPIF